MSIIMTKAALALKNAESNFQFVKFEAHKAKKKAAPDDNTKSEYKPEGKQSSKDIDLKKIRHEVVKFGMSGFDPTKKQEARIALAVSLGAKPPKKEYVNYKELMQKRKAEKVKEQEEKQLMRSKSILQTGGKKKKKTNNDVGHLLSSYGKVQKKDLKKDDKGSKKKKKSAIKKIK
ncbi:40S small subunit processome assembly factor 1 [Anticarsia gemmatalis]|uniref:40S small subunit processome assembly factor 1 n=1 Tax=Anticarsia gemmatalis TaxID=129554 RepID=UPI003F75EF8C